jgi:hypothetical protein
MRKTDFSWKITVSNILINITTIDNYLHIATLVNQIPN